MVKLVTLQNKVFRPSERSLLLVENTSNQNCKVSTLTTFPLYSNSCIFVVLGLRKMNSAIHWIVIFSTVVKMLEKL